MLEKKIMLLILTITAASWSFVNAQNANNLTTEKKNENAKRTKGLFINIKAPDGSECKMYAAGPKNAKFAVLFVHDFFGISNAARESVERLGAYGYRTIAVDLYNGKSATTNDSATALMNAKNPNETRKILWTAIEYLKMPGRKIASVGFSAGGIDALNANFMAPELFSATVIVYGGGYDKLEKETLDKLKSPLLVITGSPDEWPKQAALNFLQDHKDKMLELYVYPGADHGYAQPLFNGGKNYNSEATRVTWMLIKDFLARNFK